MLRVLTGQVRHQEALTRLNMVALTAMPSASAMTAVVVKPGFLTSWRMANRRSAQKLSSMGHWHTSRLRSLTSVRFPNERREAINAGWGDPSLRCRIRIRANLP